MRAKREQKATKILVAEVVKKTQIQFHGWFVEFWFSEFTAHSMVLDVEASNRFSLMTNELTWRLTLNLDRKKLWPRESWLTKAYQILVALTI